MVPKDVELISKTFPGRNLGDQVRINISQLYDVRYNDRMTKVYKGVNLPETDRDDVVADLSGYIGVFHRSQDQSKLLRCTIDVVAGLFQAMPEGARNEKLATIMRTIKQIDRDNNGYVTSTELDDILKLSFPTELGNKNLKPIFKEFESL
jgi:hypothetical protein